MNLSKKLTWYFKRLSVMQPSEVLHRVREQMTLKGLHVSYLLNKNTLAAHKSLSGFEKFSFCSSTQACLPTLKMDINPNALNAEGISVENSWHKAPDTGKFWPQSFFNSIPYRAGNPYGDIRIAWEPARLQQLVELALLAKSSNKEVQAIRQLESQLLSWVKDNPPLLGIHYISVMECALRLLSTCYALDKVRDNLQQPAQTWNALLQLVDSHATLIEKRLSLHSSAGNHTIAECVGLIYAGVLFPEFKAATRWKNKGLSILEQEAARQILPDGGGLEQSFWYLLFVTDLCGLVVELLEHYGEAVPNSISSAFARGKNFLNSFANSPEDLPSIGDADNGYALSPWLRISWESNTSKSKNTNKTICHTFAKAGYTLIQGQVANNPFKFIFDHGLLGMPSSYGHGHADALSVHLQVAGENILVDPGTYTYTGDAQWRHYFRSTKAHNTINIDNQDQARQETAFMWSKPFQCQLIYSEKMPNGGFRLLSKHNGYQHIDNIIHWRAIIYYPIGVFVVSDYITGEAEQAEHNIELNWHCSAAPVIMTEGEYMLQGHSIPIILSIEGSQSVRCFKGWQSTHYGSKEPINTITARTQAKLPQSLITRINLGNEAAMADIDVYDDLNRIKWIKG